MHGPLFAIRQSSSNRSTALPQRLFSRRFMAIRYHYCVRSLKHAYPCETLEEAKRILPHLCERSRRAYRRLFSDADLRSGLITDHQTGVYLHKSDLPSYLEATSSRSSGWAVTRLADDQFHIYAECDDPHLRRIYWEIRPRPRHASGHPPAAAIIEHVTEHTLISEAKNSYRFATAKPGS